MKDLYGSINRADQTLNDSTASYATAAAAPIDEAKIRNDTMSRLQTEIDATNHVYAQKLTDAKLAGANSIGSTVALNARRGLAGSDFGNANIQNETTKNNAAYAGIGSEQAAAIAAITDKGTQLANQEIQNKQAVKQNSATDYISFLTKADDRRNARTQDAANHALSAGIDLTTASPADIKAIADSFQISPDALVSTFTDAKNALAKQQADIQTAQATAAKDRIVSVPLGGSLYNTATDKVLAGATPEAQQLVSQAIQEGRLDTSQITRYGMSAIVSTLQQDPSFDFAAAHTDYAREIANSTGVRTDAFGNIITYDTKPPVGTSQTIAAPTSSDGTVNTPRANAATVTQASKKLGAVQAAHEKLKGDMAAIIAIADQVNTKGVPKLDAFINGLNNDYTNDPLLAQYRNLITTARGDYAVINSGGSSQPDQGDQARAAETIPTGKNSAVYRGLASTIDGEAARQIKAQQDIIDQFASNSAGGNTSLPTGTPASTTLPSNFKWTPQATSQGVVVIDPNGVSHTFPSMAQYKAFLAAVSQ
jgi:hypothetical protein